MHLERISGGLVSRENGADAIDRDPEVYYQGNRGPPVLGTWPGGMNEGTAC